jgi:hypothetical protein
MPLTQYLVHYATESRIVRRVIAADDDSLLLAHRPLRGESALFVQIGQSVLDAIEKATGVRPPSPRCAVVNAQGAVIGCVNADPALDTIPGATLVLHDFAIPGDQFVNGNFQRQYAVVDASSRRVTALVSKPVTGQDPVPDPGTFLFDGRDNEKVGDVLTTKARAPSASQ